MRRQAVATIALFSTIAAHAPAFATNTEILLFNLAPGTSYQVRRNGVVSGTPVAGRVGNLRFQANAVAGDRFEFSAGEDAQGPTPPTQVKATESTFGCASITWTRSSDPSVAGYRVYFGSRSRMQAAYTDSIEAGDAATAARCGLTEGNYYFSVRAYNGSGDMSAYSNEAQLSARGVDTIAPAISQRTPAPGATGVPLNAPVYFVAIDDKTGVDAAGIVVRIEGVAQSFTVTSASGGLAVQCDPAGDFASDTDIDVSLSVPDRASPPNVTSLAYRFHTGTAPAEDDVAPVISASSPAAGAEGVDPRPTIEVRLRDAALGVDLASVVLEINGEPVSFTVEGNPADLRIRYRPSSPFAAGSQVDVRVEACDRAAPANCAQALSYRFTVATSVLVEGPGVIVPDGYWANDPARPLEIQNLPRHWSVRIFDTSGSAVRNHENLTEGASWSWNFHNDYGQRVAPALYLVRVTDSSGAVQRTGRFLVQSGR